MHNVLWRYMPVASLILLTVALVWTACRVRPDGSSLPGESTLLETEEAARLEQQAAAYQKVVVWSLCTRWAIADEVSAGRMTLLEGAAGFRAIDAVKARYAKLRPWSVPGQTEEERLCRRVILFVAEAPKSGIRVRTAPEATLTPLSSSGLVAGACSGLRCPVIAPRPGGVVLRPNARQPSANQPDMHLRHALRRRISSERSSQVPPSCPPGKMPLAIHPSVRHNETSGIRRRCFRHLALRSVPCVHGLSAAF
jgi:hypothetical protein